MELILGPIVSLSASLLKRVREKLGQEVTKNLVLLFVFTCAIAISALVNNGKITTEMIKTAVTIITGAIAYYEIVTKRVINPILDKI